MKIITPVDIKNISILTNIWDNDFLSKISENIRQLQFNKNEVIIKEWELNNGKAYLIIDWKVEITREWQKYSTLWIDDLFWELSLITNEPRTATVIAIKDNTNIIEFNKDIFLELYKKAENWSKIKTEALNRILNNFYDIKD